MKIQINNLPMDYKKYVEVMLVDLITLKVCHGLLLMQLMEQYTKWACLMILCNSIVWNEVVNCYC